MIVSHGIFKPKRSRHAAHSLPPDPTGYATLERVALEHRELKCEASAGKGDKQSDGSTVAAQYGRLGITLRQANMDRMNGWAGILHRLGDVEAGIVPRLYIHQRCARLIETLPALQHDPNRPQDVDKVDSDEDGLGGDDAAHASWYMVAKKARAVAQRKLRGM